MRARHLVISALALPPVILAALLVLRPSAEGQVAANCEDLKVALAEFDTGAIMACIHPDYNFLGQWPRLEDTLQTLGKNTDNPAAVRQAVAELGGSYLLRQKMAGNVPTLTYVIKDVLADDGDTVEAQVLMGLQGSTGRLIAAIDPPRPITFVYRRSGWLRPELRIVAHDRM